MDIKALHEKYAPSQMVFDLVYTHCLIVRDIALQLREANDIALPINEVEASCMIHDIGVYPLFNADGTLKPDVAYITHGIEGERILKDEGFPESLWRVASHHTGVGLTAADITSQLLPLPEKDYLAETELERLIMYADKFHSKTTPPYFNSFQWYRQDIARFGIDKTEAFDALAIEFGKPDLEMFSIQYGFEIR